MFPQRAAYLADLSDHAPPGAGTDSNGGTGDRADRLEYEMARLPRDVTTEITWYMKERGISGRKLAELMKVTPGRVSQILSGDENLTLRTLAAVFVALDAHLQVELVPNAPDGAIPAPPATPVRSPMPSPPEPGPGFWPSGGPPGQPVRSAAFGAPL